jgi:hypothetical protein
MSIPSNTEEHTHKRDPGYTSWIKSIGRYDGDISIEPSVYSKWIRTCDEKCGVMDLDHVVSNSEKDSVGAFMYAARFTNGEVLMLIEAKLYEEKLTIFQNFTYLYMADKLNVPFYVVEYSNNNDCVFWIYPVNDLAKKRINDNSGYPCTTRDDGTKRYIVPRNDWRKYIEEEVFKCRK